MNEHRLPRRAIILIEREEAARINLAGFVGQAHRDYEIRCFTDGEAALTWLLHTTEGANSEPVLAISDRVGIPFLQQVGTKGATHPAVRKVLYTGASKEQADHWKQAGVVDTWVTKGHTAALMEEMQHQLDTYQQENILVDMRQYVEGCDKPDEPYYPVDDVTFLSIREVYRHVLQGTAIGKEAAMAWAGMRQAEKNGPLSPELVEMP